MPKGVEHNCHDFQDWLQSELDTVPVSPAGRECCSPPEPLAAGLAKHLAACPACERMHAASLRLRQGLCLFAPSALPAGLLDRVVVAVRKDRRRRQRWRFRLAGALALAASVVVIALVDRLSPAGQRPDATLLAESRSAKAESRSPEPSIRDTVAEAHSAVTRLTVQTLDQAVDRTRELLPTMDDSLLPPMELLPPLETPSLAEASDSVSAGLEPLADSARRAIALFRRTAAFPHTRGGDPKPEL